MKTREIILLVLTVAIMGGGVWLYTSDPGDKAATETATVVAGDLDTVKTKFLENLKVLKNGAKTDQAYNELAVSLDDSRTPGVDPGMAAQSELYNVLTERLGVKTPEIKNWVSVPIKNVDEYYFINVSFKVGGTELEMKKLLRDMERQGFLIQSFRLAQVNHGQNSFMEMEVTVSRLVKHDKESKERMNPKRYGRKG